MKKVYSKRSKIVINNKRKNNNILHQVKYHKLYNILIIININIACIQ